ncbi:MAG: PEP-CTERM sorting domain-containing protein [Acidobacteria bacterium]|nr:PEP-CTERM sorting domain-containing protein [Acidobacteriota bacterium]
MDKLNIKTLLAAICLASLFAAVTRIEAGPIKFDQLVQVVNANPTRSASGTFARLQVVSSLDDLFVKGDGDDDDKDKKKKTQDTRVITETRTDIVTDEDCNCEQVEVARSFPKWALLGLAAIPIAFILIRHKKDTPTPTSSIPQTPTPTPTTPTPTPETPTPTPPVTPTPPQPVPEPITILLFGTGLASVGLAARKRFGKKRGDDDPKDGEE